jgi:hypothetical protein
VSTETADVREDLSTVGALPRLAIGVKVALVTVLLAAANVWGQATAQVIGTVADSSGAVLPGVTVIATQTQTGFRREAVTDETDSYALLNLPTGPYRIEPAARVRPGR